MPRLVHLTDLHLYADAGRCLKTINPRASLAAVLAAARQALAEADALILGGDLAQDASPEAYAALKAMLDGFRLPVLVTPGNHDDPDLLARAFASPPGHLDLDGWRLIALNTHVDGEDGGRLSHAELARLERRLAEADGRHALICLHHPPVPLGSAWMDAIGLAEAPAFWSTIERHGRVRGVLFGHAHQTFEGRRGNIRLLGTPSTCIQFKPNEPRFRLDDRPPGYRRLSLRDDGGIDSEVVRIHGFLPRNPGNDAVD